MSSSEQAPMELACAVEGNYDAHSATMLRSAVLHSGGDAHVHYLHGPEHSRRSMRRIGRMLDRLGARVTFHCISHERTAGLPVVTEFTRAMWFRTLLPELLPDAQRVLYLDVDVIVTDSLVPLWRTDLADCLIGAVTNILLEIHRERPATLGLEERAYFNSGVLLMNLEGMRDAQSSAAIIEYALTHPELEWPDQDALNVILGDRRMSLHPRWNCMNALWLPEARRSFTDQQITDAATRPAIRHFEGPAANKPWHAACVHAHRETYFANRRRTPWPYCKRDGSRTERARRLVRAWNPRRSPPQT